MEAIFKNAIENLDYYELMRLRKGIESGELSITKLINEKIKEEQKKHGTCCSICSNTIEAESTNNFTLIFGPESFKKKATFCAIDCLQYFLKNLKELQKGSRKSMIKENSTRGGYHG